jgi:RNA polymerase sigma-70 factor (ECF subfamily)
MRGYVRGKPTRPSLFENARITRNCQELLRMCRGENPEDAKDLVQDTYLKFLSRRREVVNEDAYLKKMIKNMLPGVWRAKHQRAAAVPLEEALEEAGRNSQGDPSVTVAEEEIQESLKQAMQLLSPRLRAVIELETEGLSDKVIAARLGVGVATVKQHLYRARARLKEILLQGASHATPEQFREECSGPTVSGRRPA